MAVKYEVWFPHSADASNDPKIQALIEEVGWHAVGWYWDILERLRRSPDHSIDWSRPFIRTSLAGAYRTSVEHLSTFVQQMFEHFELLTIEDGKIYSHGMSANLSDLDIKRSKRVIAGKKSGENRRKKAEELNKRSAFAKQTGTYTEQSSTLVEQSRIEESRGEEIFKTHHAREDSGESEKSELPAIPKWRIENRNPSQQEIFDLVASYRLVDLDQHGNPRPKLSDADRRYLRGAYFSRTPMQLWADIELAGGFGWRVTIQQLTDIASGQIKPNRRISRGREAIHAAEEGGMVV